MEKEKWIRETWFPNHIAKIEQHGDIQVIKWYNESSGRYAMKFILDGNRMHIIGDVGTASFWFTETANVYNQSRYGLGYFAEKLECMKGDIYQFNNELACEYLLQMEQELEEKEEDLHAEKWDYDKDTLKSIMHLAEYCCSIEEWKQIVYNYEDFFFHLDQDWYEWAFDIGKKYSNRLLGYLVAIKMISEYLTQESEKK